MLFRSEGDPGTLTAMGDQLVTGDRAGNELSLRLPAGHWTVMWQNIHGGVALGPMEVEGGEIETCTLSDHGWKASGTVRNPQGTPLDGVEVWVCGDRVHTDGDGRFEGWARNRTCTVRASYRDGQLSRRSEEVQVSAFDAGAVELVVDDAPIAGMGISFKMAGDYAIVRDVTPGSPAEAAGVERGDRIHAVNGTSVAGLTDDAFIALGTGREGSSVELELDLDRREDGPPGGQGVVVACARGVGHGRRVVHARRGAEPSPPAVTQLTDQIGRAHV